jgi:hypothetical protein
MEAYLLIHCLAMDVLLLRGLACAGMCLPSCSLAIGIHVAILFRWISGLRGLITHYVRHKSSSYSDQSFSVLVSMSETHVSQPGQ